MNALNATSSLYHIISGSFGSLSLFLLAFSPVNRTLSLVEQVPGELGPHQYLAKNAQGDRVYATSEAWPPTLNSWSVDKANDLPWTVEHINSVPITATAGYISVPPPYTHVYSVGGPTGEVHAINASSGGLGREIQQVLFVPESDLGQANKTAAALANGSHCIEISSRGHAFVADLGTNSIFMYTVDHKSGNLTLLSNTQSPRENDAPRQVIISPDGKVLYSVTEHTSYVDVYNVTETNLSYRQSISILPSNSSASNYRGETLRFYPPTLDSPVPSHLFATTRGFNTSHNGFLAVFPILPTGLLDSNESRVERWQTPTSGGESNAIELKAKAKKGVSGNKRGVEGVWITLTDGETEAGGVYILEWDGEGTGGINIVAQWSSEGGESIDGASHAIWLD